MRLLTLADGFGDSQAVPNWYPGFIKWPRIIELMTCGVTLTNLARYGAGNEFILQSLRHNLSSQDVVLLQWAMPNRLDLVITRSNNFWDRQRLQDTVYRDNLIQVGPDNYWITSSSQNLHVLEYHQKYIGIRQHQLRSQMFVEHAKLLLESQGIDYRFLLTYDSDYLQETINDTTKWLWHESFKGMHNFRKVSQYADLDLGLTQPISLIHLDFIKKFIIPNLNLPWRSEKEIDAVENMLYQSYKEALNNKPNDSHP